MKVIVVGYPKTGTKTMSVALTELGYKVYDVFEHFEHHYEDWMKFYTSGGTVEDFKRMYQDVDAVVDSPIYSFWEEILEAFPDAKIVLTVRNEDLWYKSIREQLDEHYNDKALQLSLAITPSGWRYYSFLKAHFTLLGCHVTFPGIPIQSSPMLMKLKFRQHNSYVLEKAPKNKLLVYSVKQGWAPLCKFLGKDIPDKPFPRKSVEGTAYEQAFKESQFMAKMRKEMFISLGLLSSTGIIGICWLFKRLLW